MSYNNKMEQRVYFSNPSFPFRGMINMDHLEIWQHLLDYAKTGREMLSLFGTSWNFMNKVVSTRLSTVCTHEDAMTCSRELLSVKKHINVYSYPPGPLYVVDSDILFKYLWFLVFYPRALDPVTVEPDNLTHVDFEEYAHNLQHYPVINEALDMFLLLVNSSTIGRLKFDQYSESDDYVMAMYTEICMCIYMRFPLVAEKQENKIEEEREQARISKYHGDADIIMTHVHLKSRLHPQVIKTILKEDILRFVFEDTTDGFSEGLFKDFILHVMDYRNKSVHGQWGAKAKMIRIILSHLEVNRTEEIITVMLLLDEPWSWNAQPPKSIDEQIQERQSRPETTDQYIKWCWKKATTLKNRSLRLFMFCLLVWKLPRRQPVSITPLIQQWMNRFYYHETLLILRYRDSSPKYTQTRALSADMVRMLASYLGASTQTE